MGFNGKWSNPLHLPAEPIKVNKKIMAEKKVVKTSAKSLRWEKFLKDYALRNPVKFAEKKAKGEFKVIPENFA